MALAGGVSVLLLDSRAALLVPALVLSAVLGMSWNGLSFTAAAELGGARSGAALGLQQTVLSAVGVACPIAFAAIVAATSWRTGFPLVALCPLAGAAVLRRLDV
ncbi:MAG: hypothetical protein H0U03_06035 [Actinobacteria bacterium]|nr:hypothetical protein [Actinomycetota bacterium]